MLGLLLTMGCGPKPATPYPGLEAPDASDRIRAVVRLANASMPKPDPAVVVALVDRLEDEDRGVRFFAIGALDRLTGRRFGYRAHDPARAREKAVERWRRHLRASGPQTPAIATEGSP